MYYALPKIECIFMARNPYDTGFNVYIYIYLYSCVHLREYALYT